ncbi:hypothetical protein ESCO_001417 [Escovopsis weberi]|uniref:Uncharacterized protein n=1 Tax=Escovopsis weberi TaxID=150374 RepID=A0A0M9VTY6_ESCWE|nr:hypothetical protein ESCO_001417 [Escovopsis weberi]
MKFGAALAITAALTGQATAARFCSPRNGCKHGPGKITIQPDDEYIWDADGGRGYLGNPGCDSSKFALQLPLEDDVRGGKFPWRCLYIPK